MEEKYFVHFFVCVLLLSPVHNASWLLHGVPSFQTLDLKAKKDTKKKYAQRTIWWLDKGSLFLRIYGPRQTWDRYKDKKRTKPMSSHLDRTSLVNRGFIVLQKDLVYLKWGMTCLFLSSVRGSQLWCHVLVSHFTNWKMMWFDRLTKTSNVKISV